MLNNSECPSSFCRGSFCVRSSRTVWPPCVECPNVFCPVCGRFSSGARSCQLYRTFVNVVPFLTAASVRVASCTPYPAPKKSQIDRLCYLGISLPRLPAGTWVLPAPGSKSGRSPGYLYKGGPTLEIATLCSNFIKRPSYILLHQNLSPRVGFCKLM